MFRRPIVIELVSQFGWAPRARPNHSILRSCGAITHQDALWTAREGSGSNINQLKARSTEIKEEWTTVST